MDRTIAPKYKQAEGIELKFPHEIELENGVILYHFDDVKDDAVKLDISWDAGTKYQSTILQATFTNKLLFSGTSEKSAREISEAVDYYGGFFQKNIDKDHAGVTVYGLSENMESIFDIVADAISNCVLPNEEFNKEREITLNHFRVESEKVKTLCRRRFNQLIFGEDSPYGQVAAEEDFEKIQQADLQSFLNEFYLGKSPTLFLCGQVSEEFIQQLRDWSLKFVNEKPHHDLKLGAQEIGAIHEEQEDALQSAIRIGRRLFDKNHPDYFSFQLLNTVLGGYFGSRLMANIREDKGYTYGIGSGLAVMEEAGYFFIATEVGVDVRTNAIDEVFHEIERLQTELVSEEELGKVKNYMFGEFLRQSDGPLAMMECFKNIHFNKLKRSYYNDFFLALHAVTAQDLQNLAQKYLKKEDLVVVSVG